MKRKTRRLATRTLSERANKSKGQQIRVKMKAETQRLYPMTVTKIWGVKMMGSMATVAAMTKRAMYDDEGQHGGDEEEEAGDNLGAA